MYFVCLATATIMIMVRSEFDGITEVLFLSENQQQLELNALDPISAN